MGQVATRENSLHQREASSDRPRRVWSTLGDRGACLGSQDVDVTSVDVTEVLVVYQFGHVQSKEQPTLFVSFRIIDSVHFASEKWCEAYSRELWSWWQALRCETVTQGGKYRGRTQGSLCKFP